MADWAIALVGSGIPILGLLWRAVSSLVKLQLAATKLADSMQNTLDKQLEHIVEEKRHHKAVEELLRGLSGAPAQVDLDMTPATRTPSAPHRVVSQETSQ